MDCGYSIVIIFKTDRFVEPPTVQKFLNRILIVPVINKTATSAGIEIQLVTHRIEKDFLSNLSDTRNWKGIGMNSGSIFSCASKDISKSNFDTHVICLLYLKHEMKRNETNFIVTNM